MEVGGGHGAELTAHGGGGWVPLASAPPHPQMCACGVRVVCVWGVCVCVCVGDQSSCCFGVKEAPLPLSLGPVGPGLQWGSPGQGRDSHKLPPPVESGVREMNPRVQETREWRVEGERIRASTLPYPRYLRPLAGSLDDSEPPRVAGTETGSRAGLQVLQGPRRSRLPALGSLCLSEAARFA